MAIRSPRITGTIISGGGEVSLDQKRLLLIGQKTVEGTAVGNQLFQDLKSQEDVDTLFGKQSRLAAQFRPIFKLINDNFLNIHPQLDAITLPDGAGSVASVGSVAFSGVATAEGTYKITVGSRINHTYTVSVPVGATSAVVAAAFETLILLDAERIVEPSVAPVDILTFTAVNKGPVGNGISIEVTDNVEGMAVTVVAMAGGTVDPDFSSLFDEVQTIRYQRMSGPSEFGRDLYNDFLEPRFNTGSFQLLDGIAVLTYTDTFSNLINIVDPTVGVVNDRSIETRGNRKIDTSLFKGSALGELDDVISSQIAFVSLLRLTPGSRITNFVTTTTAGSADRFGGDALASLPYANTGGFILPTIDPIYEWTAEEQEQSIISGLSLMGNNGAGTEIILGENVTAYKVNSNGAPDTTFKYVNFIDTEVTIREFFKNSLISAFGQARLAGVSGGSVNRGTVVTEAILKSQLELIYSQLASDDFALTVDGAIEINGLLVDGSDFFADSLDIQIDRANRTATVVQSPIIMSQLTAIDQTFKINI